jgi:hypothetical protein
MLNLASHFPKTTKEEEEDMATRDEHLKWCKERALEYVERGDLKNAYGSMASDLRKHPETSDHPAIGLGMMLIMSQNLNSKDEMKKFIEGFNQFSTLEQ